MATSVLASQTMPSSFNQSADGRLSPQNEMPGITAILPTEGVSPRNLEDNALVVMYSAPGELVFVRPNGKYYELEPISTTDDTEDLTLQFYPLVSIFSVVKKGRYVGFKSLAAEGRTLQAVAADESASLRVNNFNFGQWESWEPVGGTFINKKWPQRSLGMEVREIQAVAVEDIRRLERHYLKAAKDAQKQLRTLEIKNQDTKRQLQEQSRIRKRTTMQHQRELEDSRSRLEEALRAKQRLEVDAVQMGARLKQKELQLQQLVLQRDSAEAAIEQKEANQRARDREIDILKEKQEHELDALRRQHRNELDKVKKQREHEKGRSSKHASEEVEMLQQKLEQTDKDKQHEMRRLGADYQLTIQQKNNEISNLRDENQKLTLAMHTIRDQLHRGFVAITSSEVAPSRAGTERSLDLQQGSFRYSPALSRNSTGRRPEDQTDTGHFSYGHPGESSITPRRGSLPGAPQSPYGRMSPVQSPDPFAMRSTSDYRPRRNDSRLSDSTGLGRTTDEISLPSRRPGSGLRRQRHPEPVNPRHLSYLDSVEDTTTKEEYPDVASSPHRPVENTTRQTEEESDAGADAEETETPREEIDTNPDSKDGEDTSNDTFVDSESVPVADGALASSNPVDCLSSTDDETEASDLSKSWMCRVAPMNDESKLDTMSDKDANLGDE